MGRRHDLCREVEPLAKVLNTLISKGVVVPLPRELSLDEALGGEALHRLNDIEVLDLQVLVNTFKVLLSHADTFLEQVLVDLAPLVSRNQHLGRIATDSLS